MYKTRPQGRMEAPVQAGAFLFCCFSPLSVMPQSGMTWLRCPVFAARAVARLQKADRCPCSASAVSSAGRASAAQSHGGSQVTIVNSGKVGGQAEFQKSLPHRYLPDTYGRTLGSPCGGTNSDRVLRTKQGAVSGAALRFLQRHLCFCKNRLSARGIGETPARAARLRGVSRPEHSVKNRNRTHKYT